MLKYLFISLCMTMTSCTLFSKNEAPSEMEIMTRDVLKKNEGVEIEVKPIPLEKNMVKL